MLQVDIKGDKLTIFLNDRPVIVHTPDSPFVVAGKGVGRFQVNAGHWSISDAQEKRIALVGAQYDAGRSSIRFVGGDYSLTFHISLAEGNLVLTPQRSTTGLNRVWLHFPATPGHSVYGAGAQYGGLDLRGHHIPLWVHEKRVGRESIPVPLLSTSGHHATFFPQPTFFTQDYMLVHIDSPAYGMLDFHAAKYHRVELWDLPTSIVIGVEKDMDALMRRMSRVLGHQATLPQWCLDGAWLEMGGGAAALRERLERALAAGVKVSAVCLRDWTGRRETLQGTKVFFDWVVNQDLYPNIGALLGELRTRNIRALAYLNPHMSIEGRLFAEASQAGYLVRKTEGGNFINDMGGFMAGHLDLTNPDACGWYKEIIKENILNQGFSGYVADMGNYLPAKAVLYNGESPNRMHNRWPVLWAKLNREAVREAGRTADAVFYTTTGYGGSCGQTMMTSTGDHNTGWGREDGLPSAITASLTLALSGMGLSLSDIGGNVSFAARRNKELFLRWAEFATFTPVMKTFDLPKQFTYDTDDETLTIFARLTRVHASIAPYIRAYVKDNAAMGIPLMRPLCVAFPDEEAFRQEDSSYMLGGELLVAPILQKGKKERKVLLPEGHWVHLWSGRQYIQGEHTVAAPIGKPPVFYRPGGKFAELFATLLGGAL